MAKAERLKRRFGIEDRILATFDKLESELSNRLSESLSKFGRDIVTELQKKIAYDYNLEYNETRLLKETLSRMRSYDYINMYNFNAKEVDSLLEELQELLEVDLHDLTTMDNWSIEAQKVEVVLLDEIAKAVDAITP